MEFELSRRAGGSNGVSPLSRAASNFGQRRSRVRRFIDKESLSSSAAAPEKAPAERARTMKDKTLHIMMIEDKEARLNTSVNVETLERYWFRRKLDL